MERCTGMLRSSLKMRSPKKSPKRQTKSPPNSRVRPLIPIIVTWLRSGRTRSSSLVCAVSAAHAGATPRVASTIRIAAMISRIAYTPLLGGRSNRLPLPDSRGDCKGTPAKGVGGAGLGVGELDAEKAAPAEVQRVVARIVSGQGSGGCQQADRPVLVDQQLVDAVHFGVVGDRLDRALERFR